MKSYLVAAAVLILAAVAKALAPTYFASGIHRVFDFTPQFSLIFITIILEMLLALWLISGLRFKLSLVVTTLVFAGFSIHHSYLLGSNQLTSCGCFGTLLTLWPDAKPNPYVESVLAWLPFLLLLNLCFKEVKRPLFQVRSFKGFLVLFVLLVSTAVICLNSFQNLPQGGLTARLNGDFKPIKENDFENRLKEALSDKMLSLQEKSNAKIQGLTSDEGLLDYVVSMASAQARGSVSNYLSAQKKTGVQIDEVEEKYLRGEEGKFSKWEAISWKDIHVTDDPLDLSLTSRSLLPLKFVRIIQSPTYLLSERKLEKTAEEKNQDKPKAVQQSEVPSLYISLPIRIQHEEVKNRMVLMTYRIEPDGAGYLIKEIIVHCESPGILEVALLV